jgi:plastocyanin
VRRGIGLATVIVSVCAVTLPSGTAVGAPAVRPRGSEPPGELSIAVEDFYFDPGAPTIGRGDTVTFDFVGDVTHTATDSSGLELFDSGNVPPGSGPSLWFAYEAAGVYNFVCTPHTGMGGRVSVPMRAAPATGRRHATFTLVWASAAATGDHVYDVQIKRPGGTWSIWRIGVTIRRDTIEPSTAGRYRFRARMRDVGLDESSRWSPASSISVG